MRSRQERRGAYPRGRFGGKYGPRVRQGVLREQYPPAAVGARRQSVGHVVREAAQPVREAHRLREGRRLLRRHPSGRHASEIAQVLCRGRRQERGAPRRHGYHRAVGRDCHRPHPRLLFSGRGQRHGRHCGLGGQHAPYRGRLLRRQHHAFDGVAERSVRAHVRRLARRFSRFAAVRCRQGPPRRLDNRRQGVV